MNKLTIALLLGTLLGATLPSVNADEANPDCEDNVKWQSKDENGNYTVNHTSDQGWIGYQSSEPVRQFVTDVLAASGTGTTFRNCEGEHWDGQDAASSQGTEACSLYTSEARTDGETTVSKCMDSDPNNGSADPLSGSTEGVRARATADNGANKEAYVGLDIGPVGRVALYAGKGSDGHYRQAVWLRDNTAGDLLAQAVSAPGITKGYVSGDYPDCDQSTYQTGAMNGDRTLCGRDNTAITLDEQVPLLP